MLIEGPVPLDFLSQPPIILLTDEALDIGEDF
jgi:hypothetical protein